MSFKTMESIILHTIIDYGLYVNNGQNLFIYCITKLNSDIPSISAHTDSI